MINRVIALISKHVMKVFLDSNIFQHSATTYRTSVIYFGGAKPGESLVRRGPIKTIHKKPAQGEELRKEIECLPKLAAKLKQIEATLITDFENIYSEVHKVGFSELFYGSHIRYANRPPAFETSWGVPSWLSSGPTKNRFHNFLHRLKNPRFLELARYAGGLQGTCYNYNQLADAYFLWCAEVNCADYFLTLDFRLRRSVSKAKGLVYNPKIVTATELLTELNNSRSS